MAIYSHIYLCILHIGTQEVCAKASKHIQTKETGMHYNKLKHLWRSTTQLPFRGLQYQPRYPDL